MFSFSARGENERLFVQMIDFVQTRAFEIFGNNQKYYGLLMPNLPLINLEYKRDNLSIGLSQGYLETSFAREENLICELIKDIHTLLVDVLNNFGEYSSFINGSISIHCSDVTYYFYYDYNKSDRIFMVNSEVHDYSTSKKGDKIPTEIQIDPVSKNNDIATGKIKIKYGNKNAMTTEMNKYCPKCHAVIPAGQKICKNCQIDVTSREPYKETYAEPKQEEVKKKGFFFRK